MFFDENQINSKLVCAKCKERYHDPRILPCGESLCHPCILRLIEKNNETHETKNGFDCLFCAHFHEQPADGFVTCKFLNTMLGEKPCEVYRGHHHEILKTNLRLIQKKTEQLNGDLRHGAQRIKAHCDALRAQVQLDIASLADGDAASGKARATLLEQIDMYEFECVEEFESLANEKIHLGFHQFIFEMNLFCKSWYHYMNKSQIDDAELFKAMSYSANRIFRLKKEELAVKNFIFNKSLLVYEGCGALGRLVEEPIHGVDFNKLQRVDIGVHLADAQRPYIKFNAEFLETENIVCAVLDSTGRLLLKVLDEEGKLVHQMQPSTSIAGYGAGDKNAVSDFLLVVSRNTVVLYKEYRNSHVSHLELFDEQLKLRKCVELKYKAKLLSANETRIYALDFNKMHVYDHELAALADDEQKLAFLNLYFERDLVQFEIQHDRIYVLEADQLRILNKKNGDEILAFPVAGRKFTINPDHQIVVIDEREQRVTYHSRSDGTDLYDDELTNSECKELLLVYDKSRNETVFVDVKNDCFYK